MECPSPHCAGELPEAVSVRYCPDCREGVLVCAHCGSANYHSAQFCRNCGRPLNWALMGGLDEVDIAKFGTLTRTVTLEDSFWSAPLQYRGELWAVSRGGDIWRLALADEHGQKVDNAGARGVGGCPSVIALLPSSGSSHPARPNLIMIGHRSVVRFDLLTRRIHRLYKAEEGESFLCDSASAWVRPAVGEGEICVLSQVGEGTGLVRIQAGGQAQTTILAKEKLNGPFSLGSAVAAYSRHAVYAHSGAALQQQAFPSNFSPFMPGTGISGLDAPFGSTPWIALSGSVYIPGTVDGRSGFLYVPPLESGRNPIWLPLGKAGFATDGLDSLLVARRGKLEAFRRGVVQQRRDFADLAPKGFPFRSGDLWMSQIETSAGYEGLVLIWNDFVARFPIPQLPGAREGATVTAAGVYRMPGALLFAYAAGNDQLRIASWDI